jgi:hypothetical protein
LPGAYSGVTIYIQDNSLISLVYAEVSRKVLFKMHSYTDDIPRCIAKNVHTAAVVHYSIYNDKLQQHNAHMYPKSSTVHEKLARAIVQYVYTYIRTIVVFFAPPAAPFEAAIALC